MAESENIQLLNQLLGEVAQLRLLVLNGGKESPIVERVPLWTSNDCDSTCDVSDVPVPKRRRVSVGEMRVHPGVAAYFAAHKGIDPDDFDGEIPADYLVTPPLVRIRKRYYHRPQLEWDESQLTQMGRPALLAVARDLGIFDLCRQISKQILLRKESTEWVRTACTRVKAQEGLPDFGSASNIEAVERASKKKSGGAHKTKPEKKTEEAKPNNPGLPSVPSVKSEKTKPSKKTSKTKSTPKKKLAKKSAKKAPKKVAKKAVAKGKKKAAKKKGK